MAEILPIKAWRYNPGLNAQIEELTSPLFDVVSPKQREALYKNDKNSIHLSVPKGKNPAIGAKKTLVNWKNEGVILQDKIPGIYVYYQYFTLSGEEKEFCRKGFISHIKAYDWDEKMIVRHENTIEKAVNDRIEILRETAFQTSPTHGLYDDPDFLLENYMDEAISDPLYDIEDYQGVREVLGVIHDAKIIHKFCQLIKGKKIILADGHHRLEGAIAHRKKQKASNPSHNDREGYNYHMMYLTNAAAKGLKILPTHRLFQDIHFSEAELTEKLSAYFTIKEVSDPQEIGDLIINQPWAFGLIFKYSAYKIRLKPEMVEKRADDIPKVVKELDVEVLHHFFIEKVLGIPREKQRFSNKVDYERNLNRCHLKVSSGEADFAVITKGVTMKEVMEVAECGYVMPQKSTYFYPKAISGLMFGSIAEDEFKFPYEMFL
ncbi:MAG: DUF1015 domain-containing protein [Anditalea sp.]